MLKNFARWLFEYTHKKDIEQLKWWAEYHKSLSNKPLDYSYGIYNGIENCFHSFFNHKIDKVK
jgi:hypothetical protein